MIGAAHLDRGHQPPDAELLDARLGEVQVLDAPADLLAGERLGAELALRDADRLRRDHRRDQPAVVVDGPDALRRDVALAGPVHLVEDLLDRGKVRPGGMEARGHVADRRLAGGDDVLLGPAPPHADDLRGREADTGRFLERGRVHHAPAAQDDPVRLVAPRDLQPRGLLIEPGMRDREVADLEAVHLRLLVEDRDRLLAVARLMVEVGDLLALQAPHAAFLHPDVLDLRRVLAPVVGHQGEDVGEDLAVGGVGAPVSHRDERDLVGGGPLDEPVGDAGGERMHDARAGRPLALEAFVALDPAVGVVRRLALFPCDLHAADPAVAHVEQLEVVLHAAPEPGAARGVGAGAVHERGDELLVLGLRGREGPEHQARGDHGEQRSCGSHR